MPIATWNLDHATDYRNGYMDNRGYADVRIEYKTRSPNLHEVSHDFGQQWLRHLRRQGDVPDKPLTGTFKGPQDIAQKESADSKRWIQNWFAHKIF